jgi:hypothetical protein
MITKILLDVVSCEFKKKMFKERRSCGSNEGPVKFSETFCPVKKSLVSLGP